jgi:hypothetical protein
VDVDRIPSILLQTFLTVAEAGQISEAARRLHLRASAVADGDAFGKIEGIIEGD